MLPAEIQRIVLLIGLAATGYLLILAWNEDAQEARTTDYYSAEPEIAGIESARNAIPTERSQPTDAVNDDIPVMPLPSNNVQPQSTTTEPYSADRLITVTTSSIKMWIDLEGGDVVRVLLPKFPVQIDDPDIPFVLLDQGQQRIYVAQSGLIGADGTDSNGERPLFSSERTSYVLDQDELEVVLRADVAGNPVEKIFRFRADDYLVDVEYRVVNNKTSPFEAGMFAQIKRDRLPPTLQESFFLAPQPFYGGATTTLENRYEKLEFGDIDEQSVGFTQQGGWIAFLQHYFLSAWVPPVNEQNRFEASRSRDGNYLYRTIGQAKQIAPGDQGVWQAGFYAGPKDQIRLEQIAPYLNMTVDYGFLWWIAEPLFKFLNYFHTVTGNWGMAIILLTLLVKGALYWVSAKGYRSMANMRRVAPAMKRIQERYANDREKLSREMMALYKKEGANPLGSCLPMLLPMPIFLALYWVLLESVELRQAPFLFWINDLSAMDPYFILPLLMGASTYLMQALNPQVGDPMQVKIMKMMPIMFTVLFLFFPAGLVLYWLVNNLLSIAQQTFVYRQVEKERATSK
ncbi:MAG: membrane protein insertase YidC [Pseudomonadota bacterium]|nr:membrane protein insertase YidC [Pseudomonadota bacterium]MEE2823448.1 membrane protein insertase YidC [Pseudomonadota bacterium]